MNESQGRVELQIWREDGASGAWCCRVVAPGVLQSVRLDDHVALSSYVAGQVDMFIERHTFEQAGCENP